MADVDDIFASMLLDDSASASKAMKRAKGGAGSVNKGAKLKGGNGTLNGKPKKVFASKVGRRSAKAAAEAAGAAAPAAAPAAPAAPAPEAAPASAVELLQRLARGIQQCGDDDQKVRRQGLATLSATVLSPSFDSLPASTVNELMHALAKPLFKRLDDSTERNREVAIALLTKLLGTVDDVTPHLAYFYPALAARGPPNCGFTAEENVGCLLVHDIDAYDAWRRGNASADRPDRETIHSMSGGGHSVKVGEPSEELRAKLISMLGALVTSRIAKGNVDVLSPYWHETLLFVASQLRDPFAGVKVAACRLLELIAAAPMLQRPTVPYAVGIARAMPACLRHRHAKVRAAAIDACCAVVAIPFKDKCKGAGTEAIVDLVGFREDNVLPIRAFYGKEVSVNSFAELTNDPSVLVRERFAKCLAHWLTKLPDRYDHQTRLLPYLLNAVCDDCPAVNGVAMDALVECGRQYEQEHPDDVIEKRQYGVDGDLRMNHDLPPPTPFKCRQRIGTRLYVRGNTMRVLKPILGELSNWISKTRLQSAKLLRTIVFYCEEHLTSEMHSIVPALCKAAAVAGREKEPELVATLREVVTLLGRYMVPDSYVPFLIPRVKGDLEVLPSGTDTKSRAVVLSVLTDMMAGTKASELVPHATELVELLTAEDLFEYGSETLLAASCTALQVLLSALAGRGQAAVEAHFLATGRLPSAGKLWGSALRALLAMRRSEALKAEAEVALTALADVQGLDSLEALLAVHGVALFEWLETSFPVDALWERHGTAHAVLDEAFALLPRLEAVASGRFGHAPHVVAAASLAVPKAWATLGALGAQVAADAGAAALGAEAGPQCRVALLELLEASLREAADPAAAAAAAPALLRLALYAHADDAAAVRQARLAALAAGLLPDPAGGGGFAPLFEAGAAVVAEHVEAVCDLGRACLGPPAAGADAATAAHRRQALGLVAVALRCAVGPSARLKSFAKQKAAGAGAGPAAAAAPSAAATSAADGIADLVLQRLDDPNEDARLAAVEAAAELVYYLREEAAVADADALPPPPKVVEADGDGGFDLKPAGGGSPMTRIAVEDDDESDDERATTAAALEFGPFLERCLPHAYIGERTDAFDDRFDGLLRAVAVLDPEAFVARVAAHDDRSRKAGAPSQVIADMLEHGAMLVGFMKR